MPKATFQLVFFFFFQVLSVELHGDQKEVLATKGKQKNTVYKSSYPTFSFITLLPQ